jgi:hypothetical protein
LKRQVEDLDEKKAADLHIRMEQKKFRNIKFEKKELDNQLNR